MSYISKLGLGFYFMSKKGNFWSFVKTYISRLHETKTRT